MTSILKQIENGELITLTMPSKIDGQTGETLVDGDWALIVDPIVFEEDSYVIKAQLQRDTPGGLSRLEGFARLRPDDDPITTRFFEVVDHAIAHQATTGYDSSEPFYEVIKVIPLNLF